MLASLFGVILLDWIGFGVLLPILPFYTEAYAVAPENVGVVWGALLSVYAAMQFLCAPWWGRLSDRVGRRPVLLLTILGGALGLGITAYAPSLAWLFVGRIVAGICAANLGVASAYVADVTDDAQRTRGMAMIGVAIGLGFVLGPALGALLSPLGFRTPILIAAGLNLLNALQVLIALPEPARHHAIPTPLSLRVLLRRRRLFHYVLINFGFIAGVMQLEAATPLFLKHEYGYTMRQVGWVFAGMAIIMVLIQGGLVRRLTHVPERWLIIVGAGVMGVAAVLLPWGWTMGMMLGLLMVTAAGRAGMQPALMSAISKEAEATHRGQVMGVFHAAGSLARCFPFVAGLLYDWNHHAPFVFGGIMILVIAGLAMAEPVVVSCPRLCE